MSVLLFNWIFASRWEFMSGGILKGSLVSFVFFGSGKDLRSPGVKISKFLVGGVCGGLRWSELWVFTGEV
jgi:hypothetical protein